MARPVNKKSALKKQCKEYELSIKESLKLQDIHYHAKSLELDAMQTRGHIINYVYDAIADVRLNASEYKDDVIDDAFCELHGLPTVDRFHDELSDAQALFVSLIVNELYPDIDDLLKTQPNTAMLLLTALARDKLNKAGSAIEEDNFEKAELLIEEVRGVAEMIVMVHSHLNPAPYKSLNEEKQQHKKSVSDMRSELVKKTAKYGFSLELRALVVDYAENVKLLLEHHNMLDELTDITIFSVKGLDLHFFGDMSEFYKSLSNLAYEFEEKYEALYMQSKIGGDNDHEDIFISLATIRRHLVDIVS